jgi:hypothetical protein
MKTWASKEEIAWLTDKLPEWRKTRAKKKVADWLTTTTNQLIAAFPDRKNSDYKKLRSVSTITFLHVAPLTVNMQRVKDWYYHHCNDDVTKSMPTLQLFPLKLSRKPSRLTPHQAYSILFCKDGTALYTELRSEWEDLKAGDEGAVNKYRHLFQLPLAANMKFVTFQQAVLKERMHSITEEESQEVQKLIETRLQEDTTLYNNPWQSLKVDSTQSDIELKKQYIAR